jgi:hypothetical protein
MLSLVGPLLIFVVSKDRLHLKGLKGVKLVKICRLLSTIKNKNNARYEIHSNIDSLNRSLIQLLTHPPTHSVNYPRAHPLTHSLIQPPTFPSICSLNHSLNH